jgi:hypothetical protein
MPLSSWTFGVFSKSGTAQEDDDKNTSEISMPGAWDCTSTCKGQTPFSSCTTDASRFELTIEDSVPAFPALNSIQRSGSSRSETKIDSESPEQSPSIRVLASDDDAKLMPPPAFLPLRHQTGSGLSSGGSQQSSLSLLPSSPSSSSSLLAPPSTTTVPPNTNTKKNARAKVALTPGHSPLDWARLKSSGEDLRVCCAVYCFIFCLSASNQNLFFCIVDVFELILRCVRSDVFCWIAGWDNRINARNTI